MTLTKKSVSIEINQVNKYLYAELAVIGKLCHEDYAFIAPMLDEAINNTRYPNIRLLADLREFEGLESRAVRDDLRLGVKYRRHFSRIAVVGNKTWEKYAVAVGRWFVRGESRYFENIGEAVYWINHETK